MSNSISSVSDLLSSAAANSAASSTASSGSRLSIDECYQLIAAEFKYQSIFSDDSSGGSSTSSSISEMLNITMLEQMQSIATAINLTSASASVGKSAIYLGTDTSGKSAELNGVISAVDLSGDTPAYLINGAWVPQSSIQQIYDASQITDE